MNQQTKAQNLIIIATVLCSGLFLNSLITAETFAATHSISITTSGPKNIDISPNIHDGTTIATDDIAVSTTCRYGYNFSISTSVSSNNLYLNGDSNNNVAGTYFTPVSGSTPLASSPDSWGYYYNSDDIKPTSSSNFLPVPTLDSTPGIIKAPLSIPSDTDINDEFSIYYGVAVSDSMPTGTYKMLPDSNNVNGTIVYYATPAEPCTSYTVHFDPTGTNMGDSVTGSGIMFDQKIYEDVPTPLATNNYIAPTIGGTEYFFLGWNTAQDGSGTQYVGGEQVTNLAPVGSTITLYAQWTDCLRFSICYKQNGSYVKGTMGRQGISNAQPLNASNFSREGYGFAGWNTKSNGTGIMYGPQEQANIDRNDYITGGLNLYSTWVEPAKDYSNNILTFQTNNLLTVALLDNTTLASKPVGYVTALKDARDNQVYAIAKLADGNYWMIENLRLENTANENSTGILAQGYHSSFIGLANPETSPWGNTASNSLYSGSNIIGDSSNLASRFPRYNNDNTANRASNPTNDSRNIYSYGNYYTWAAAIADTTDYDSGDHGTTSICPTGWRLPIGRESTAPKSFGALSAALGGPSDGSQANSDTSPTGEVVSKAFRSFPNNFLFSGYYSSGSANSQGSEGNYWSSTTFSDGDDPASASALQFGYSSVSPGGKRYKTRGASIRCLLDS